MAQSCKGSTCHACLKAKARARRTAQRLMPLHAVCYCCGAEATTMDHEVPLSTVAWWIAYGEGNHLAPMCAPCNGSKYNRDRCYLEHGSRSE